MRRRRRRLHPIRWLVIWGALIWISRASDRASAVLLAPYHLAQGVATGVEIQQIHAALIRERQVNGAVLAPERFISFVRSNFSTPRGDPARDIWGRTYGYAVRRDGRGFVLWSSGPDGRQATSDDITLRWEESP
jgi:hypothetical protein